MTLQAAAPELVLASGSAARRAVLSGAGLVFAVRPAAVDEAALKRAAMAERQGPAAAALRLAGAKAAAVAAEAPAAVVIGADQILVCEELWYDKPPDMAAARDHLLALRGRTHILVTAIACHYAGRVAWQHVSTPRLTMRPFSDRFLDAYLSHEGASVLASVGAYRLEGAGIQLFAAVEGEYSAILGLPLLPLLGFLREVGVVPA